MANNLNILQKSTGDFRTAAEDNIITNWGNSPIQPLTTFTDTNIIVDGTASYSIVKAITTSTHSITASDVDGNAGTALSAEHEEGNYKTTRYSFSQDCTLTLVGFDTTGNKTGTITPIVSGTYDFYFVSGTFGINLLVKSNATEAQTQLSQPTNFAASAGNTQVALTWSLVASATGYSLEFHNGDAIWAGVPAYDGTSTSYTHTSLSNGTTYFYRLKATASGYTDSAYSQTNATPNLNIVQLTAPVLNSLSPANTQVTLSFTNNGGGNEDDSLIQYKLDSEPTVWTNGVVLGIGVASGIQTGLINDLLYDFRLIHRGSGSYSDSDPSNELSSTPSAIVLVTSTKAIALNGATSNGFTLPSNASLDVSGGVTVSAWVKHKLASASTIISDQDNSPTDLGWAFYLTTNNTVAFQVWNSGAVVGNNIKIESGTNIGTGWTHITAKFDSASPTSAGLELFIDGVKEASPVRTDAGTFTTAGFPDNAAVGYNVFNGLQGTGQLLDQVAILNATLSDANCVNLYANGNYIDFLNNAFTSSDIVGWWRMEDDILDETTNNIDGTPVNNIVYTAI